MNNSPGPTEIPESSNLPVLPKDTSSLGKRSRAFLVTQSKKHWKEILGFAVSGSVKTVSESKKLLPLPADLMFKGMFWWVTYSALAVLIAGVHFKLRSRKAVISLRPIVIPTVLAFVGFALVWPALFYLVEWWWKQPGSPSAFLYDFLEPQIYGLSFACVTAFVAYGALLTMKLFKRVRD